MSDITNKQIWSALSMPLKWAFGIALALTGISIFGAITTISSWVSEYKNILPLDAKIFIAFAVFVGIMFVSFGILAFSSAISLIRLKFNSGNFTKNCEQCSETSTSLKNNNGTYSDCNNNHSEITNEMGTIAKTLEKQVGELNVGVTKVLLADYILDEGKITELESKVKEGARIVVMTTTFHLDRGKLINIILDNIRKGVKYQYLVSGEKKEGEIKPEKDHRDFCDLIKRWWTKFKSDIFECKNISKIKEKNYCSDYIAIAEKANRKGVDKNEILEDAWRYFANHVTEYLVGKYHSLITVIMYQQEPAQYDDIWEIIIKLPTVTNKNYYAFKIPGEESGEKAILIRSMEDFCNKENIENLEKLN
jgi:hypothetical protein